MGFGATYCMEWDGRGRALALTVGMELALLVSRNPCCSETQEYVTDIKKTNQKPHKCPSNCTELPADLVFLYNIS